MIHAFLVTIGILAAIWAFPMIVTIPSVIVTILSQPELWKFLGKALYWIAVAALCFAFPPGGVIALIWIIVLHVRHARKNAIRDI
jgi:hypothetical protein